MMRSLHTLDWHSGQSLFFKPAAATMIPFVRLWRLGCQVLYSTTQYMHHYLKNIEAAHTAYRHLFQHHTADNRYGRHRHIPYRVWQRRSALLTMLASRQAVQTGESNHSGMTVSLPNVDNKLRQGGGYSFNVVHIRCKPIWSSNFFEMGLIEQELDYFNQSAQAKKTG